MKKIRIGSGAGYAGDRIEPAIELMEKGDLDYIIFECLAERTIAIAQKEKLKDQKNGYNAFLEERMTRILRLAKEKKIKVITNMGAANPRAAAEKTAEIAEKLGLHGMKIAAVLGDDISENIETYYDRDVLELSCKLERIKDKIISANVYLGCEGIVTALQNGADIVITGRVADPALVIGPLLYEFDWGIDEEEKMGQAVLAGHLLECAGQVTGGYYADPGYKEVPDLYKLGFPYVEIDETGKFHITKVENSGGMVSEDTCKEQMIYEIHDPGRYITPDAIADFTKVTFTETGKDTVAASGAHSSGRPELLKVSIGYRDCFIGEGEISYGGSSSLQRAKLAADIIEKRLPLIGAELDEYRVDYIGYNSLFKDSISDGISNGCFPEIRLRISGRAEDYRNAKLVGNEVEALYTNGPAGGSGAKSSVEEIFSICSIFVPRSIVKHRIEYREV